MIGFFDVLILRYRHINTGNVLVLMFYSQKCHTGRQYRDRISINHHA